MNKRGNLEDLSQSPAVGAAVGGGIDERMKECGNALKNFRADYLLLLREMNR